MSSGVIASTGQASTQASQSMHSSGSMYSWSCWPKSGSSAVGWMQSTGQTSTHEVSFIPRQGCLTLAVALGTGAVFKLVAAWFPAHVGAVTGVVGAAGGLGGFFPPLVLAAVYAATGGYAIGFVLLAAVSALCLLVLAATVDAAGFGDRADIVRG